MLLQRHGFIQQQTGAAPAFSPDDIPDLIGWWGDQVNTGVTRSTLSNDTAITQWDDLSGNANHWFNSTANTPKYKTASDSIYFNETDNNEILRNDFRVGYSAGTIFYVATINDANTAYHFANQWIDNEAGATKNSFTFISRFGSEGLELFGSNASLPRLSFGTPAQLGTGFHVFRTQWEVGDDLDIFVDNAFKASGATPSSIDDSLIRWRGIGSARFSPDVTDADFRTKEIIVYNRKLSTSEIADVEQYLNDKYSVYINSPDEISGLVAWYGDTVNGGTDRTTLSDATDITQWDDQSGNGWHLTGTTAYPSYSASTDGIYHTSTEYLRNEDFNAITGSANSVFFVYKPYLLDGDRALWLGDIDDSANGSFYNILNNSDGDIFISHGAGASDFDANIVVNEINCVNITVNGTNWDSTVLRNNGVEATEQRNDSVANNLTRSIITNGGWGSSSGPDMTFGMEKEYYEIIIYNRVLSADEIVDVETYLNKKYSIF